MKTISILVFFAATLIPAHAQRPTPPPPPPTPTVGVPRHHVAAPSQPLFFQLENNDSSATSRASLDHSHCWASAFRRASIRGATILKNGNRALPATASVTRRSLAR